MRLPATTYRHGHNQDRRGNNTGVSPNCFTAHPVMGGESHHCTHLTVHYPSPVTLEGGYDKARIPQSRDSALSLWPRPGLDPASTPSTVPQGKKDGMARRSGSFHRLILYITVPRDGRPLQGTSLQSPQQGSIKHHLKAPSVLASPRPIKRAGRGFTTDRRQRATNHTPVKSQVPIHSKSFSIEINISSNRLCTFFPLETWALGPLSQACNPYASTSVQGNTKLSPSAGRRAFFCPNQDKPSCVLLASPSRIGTRSTYSSV
jgi:hypothetical protein